MARARKKQGGERIVATGGLQPGKVQANHDKPWMACAGALASLRAETREINKRIDEEFGRLEEWSVRP